MGRKQRCRRIGGFPDYWRFSPEDAESPASVVTMSLDEYEAVRLLDREGMTQEQCAGRMDVARTTVTAIYANARKKIALALVEGYRLQIEGGEYQLPECTAERIRKEGTDTMRIAVTYNNGEVFQHFGHTEHFKLYDVQDGAVKSEQIVDTNGSGHGALAVFLKQHQVDALICGGIGMGAQDALAEAGIKLYGGVSGNADAAVKALVSGTLQFDSEAKCDHHEPGYGHGHHHDHGHTCGSHGCGAHGGK